MRDPHPALPAAGTGTAARSRVSPGLRECSPVPGDAAPLWGKHPAPGTQPGSRGHCLTTGMQPCSPGCSRVPGMEPGSREHRLAARMQSGTRECSSAPGDAASLPQTQPGSGGRSPSPGSGRPRAPRDGPFVLGTRTRGRTRCHAALIVHVTAHSEDTPESHGQLMPSNNKPVPLSVFVEIPLVGCVSPPTPNG